MATESSKEEFVLEFKVDQGDLLKEAQAAKRALLETKDAQKELNKEFAKGTISIDKYTEETVQLEQKLKQEQGTYNNLTKAINTNSNSLDAQRLKLSQLTKERNALDRSTAAGVKEFDRMNASIKKLNAEIAKHEQKGGDFRRNVGNYTQSIKDAANEMNIAGVNVGALTTRLASFANPVTAAVGLVTALGAAYARSTSGAKDLEFAQKQLSAAVTLSTNAFASLISSTEDGEGILSKITSAFLTQINPTLGAFSRLLADYAEQLEDLGREELKIRSETAQLLEENQELQTKIADEQTTINDKLQAAAAINANLVNAKAIEVDILDKQIKKLESIFAFDSKNEDLETLILEKTLQRDKVSTSINKKVEANNRLIDDLNRKLAAQLELERRIAAASGRNVAIPAGANPVTGDQFNQATGVDSVGKEEIRSRKLINDQLERLNKEAYYRDARNKDEANKAKEKSDKAVLDNSIALAAQAARLGEEGNNLQKAAALAAIGVDTAEAISALTAASENNPANAFTFGGAGLAQFLAGLTRIFANIATAKQYLGFSEGGYTGPGHKYQPAGVVHKGEVVWSQDDVSAMGGPAVVNRMRPTYPKSSSLRGYADGGIVTAGAKQTNEAAIGY